MNERIQQLAEQAGFFHTELTQVGPSVEKFAELIVKKVLDEVAFRAFVSGDTAWSDDADRHWVELEFGIGRLAKLKKK